MRLPSRRQSGSPASRRDHELLELLAQTLLRPGVAAGPTSDRARRGRGHSESTRPCRSASDPRAEPARRRPRRSRSESRPSASARRSHRRCHRRHRQEHRESATIGAMAASCSRVRRPAAAAAPASRSRARRRLRASPGPRSRAGGRDRGRRPSACQSGDPPISEPVVNARGRRRVEIGRRHRQHDARCDSLVVVELDRGHPPCRAAS